MSSRARPAAPGRRRASRARRPPARAAPPGPAGRCRGGRAPDAGAPRRRPSPAARATRAGRPTARRRPSARSCWRMAIAAADAAALTMSGVSPSDGSCSRATVGRPSAPATSVHGARVVRPGRLDRPSGQVLPAAVAPAGDHQLRVTQDSGERQAQVPAVAARARCSRAATRSARALRPWSCMTAIGDRDREAEPRQPQGGDEPIRRGLVAEGLDHQPDAQQQAVDGRRRRPRAPSRGAARARPRARAGAAARSPRASPPTPRRRRSGSAVMSGPGPSPSAIGLGGQRVAARQARDGGRDRG